MNKPISQPIAAPDIGPLDEPGEQIWSPEEEAAIARIEAHPDFWPSLARADAQIDRGEYYSTQEVRAWMKERKREWFAEKGITPPPGYFDS